MPALFHQPVPSIDGETNIQSGRKQFHQPVPSFDGGLVEQPVNELDCCPKF
jgi:hypothetical protein